MFTDFQYGTEMLSDYGLTVCSFDRANGLKTVSPGSQLTFNTVKTAGSSQFHLFGAQYNDVYTASFQCCKMDGKKVLMPISAEEFSQLNRWLNRRDCFQEFKINAEGYGNIRFYGSFNIQAVLIEDRIWGLECSFTSNAPFAYGEEQCFQLTGKQFTIFDSSDEIGECYPYTEIICLESGDLELQNTLDNEILVLKNCTANEKITIDHAHKLIRSSNGAHDLANDFNYNFIKIINRYGERNNVFSSSLPLNMTLKYSPVRKVGL